MHDLHSIRVHQWHGIDIAAIKVESEQACALCTMSTVVAII